MQERSLHARGIHDTRGTLHATGRWRWRRNGLVSLDSMLQPVWYVLDRVVVPRSDMASSCPEACPGHTKEEEEEGGTGEGSDDVLYM